MHWSRALDAAAVILAASALLCVAPPLKDLRANFRLGKSLFLESVENQLKTSAELLLMCAVLVRREENSRSGCKAIHLKPRLLQIHLKDWLICHRVRPPDPLQCLWHQEKRAHRKSVILFLCSCDPCCWKEERHV